MNFVDEQAGETSHQRHKFSRLHFARKTSAEDNLTDMMKEALTWSDPKLSYLSYTCGHRVQKRDPEFEAEMSKFCIPATLDSECSMAESEDSEDDESEEDSDC